MKLKSPTDTPVQVALLSGHAISIGPEGRDVPRFFLRDALIAGAVMCDGHSSVIEAPCEEDEGERMARIRETIKTMLEDGCELTRAGLPNRNDLSRLAGFYVSADELAEAWRELEAEAGNSESAARGTA